ncbi:dsDNA-mimic protein [Citrobacter freundii]|nr:dsDNA-mimic protein [Citrobacter freundii]
MNMDLNNRLTEDETLEQAYDIFLELAADNLEPADIILFNLQFEERGGAELFDPAEDWQEHVDFDLNPDFFAEVVIGLADTEDGEINDIFARVLLCREKRSQALPYSLARIRPQKAALAAFFIFSPAIDFRSGYKTERYAHAAPADTVGIYADIRAVGTHCSYVWLSVPSVSQSQSNQSG